MARLHHDRRLDRASVLGVDDAEGAQDGQVARKAQEPELFLRGDAGRDAVDASVRWVAQIRQEGGVPPLMRRRSISGVPWAMSRG